MSTTPRTTETHTHASDELSWFARAANHTIRHNYQHPVGSAGWSATRAVGNSPANLASNPAVTSDASGILTLKGSLVKIN